MRIVVLLPTMAVGAAAQSSEPPKAIKALFDYLTMAGSSTVKDFKPLSPAERNRIYLRSPINPVWYRKGASSAGVVRVLGLAAANHAIGRRRRGQLRDRHGLRHVELRRERAPAGYGPPDRQTA